MAMRFDVAVDVDGNKNNDINTNNTSNSIIINNNCNNNILKKTTTLLNLQNMFRQKLLSSSVDRFTKR